MTNERYAKIIDILNEEFEEALDAIELFNLNENMLLTNYPELTTSNYTKKMEMKFPKEINGENVEQIYLKAVKEVFVPYFKYNKPTNQLIRIVDAFRKVGITVKLVPTNEVTELVVTAVEEKEDSND